MKIHILATPRSGATAYALQLSRELNVPVINEPFKFANYHKKVRIGLVPFGGGISDKLDSYVAHHIVSQYLTHYDPMTIPSDHKLIFIDRRDKWQQMLSYFAGIELHKKYNTWHNLNYEPEVITVKERFIQRLLHEWVLFDVFTSKFPDIEVLYYEDLKFDNSLEFKKNQGFENIVIENKQKIYDYYEIYIKNRPWVQSRPTID